MALCDITVKIDASQLDEALRKIEILAAKSQQSGVSLDVNTVATAVAVLAVSPKKFTRRSLLGFWKR